MKRKILIHSLIFSPDGVSTAYLYNDIALAFKDAGYEVVVLSTTPHFNLIKEQLEEQPLKWGIWGIYKRSVYKGIPVYHVPQKKFKSTLMRLIGFVYWHIISFFVGLTIKNVDVILSPSPPLTIGRLNNILAKIKGCKVVYNVQEIYPDILGKEGSFIHQYLSHMEKKVYDRSDAVITIDKVFYDNIVSRFDNPNKLHIIPNFVDTTIYYPRKQCNELDKETFPDNDKIKVLYAGNIGYAQDWDTLLLLAEKTKEINVEFIVIGEGVMKDNLIKMKEDLQLSNLRILSYQPRNLMPAILAYSDIQFIFMTKQMEMQGFPSKIYTIMACAKPLLIGSGRNTPIVNFLDDIGCAKIVESYDINSKTDDMVEWLSNITRNQLQEMGQLGEKRILELYTKDIVTKQYVELIDSLL